MSPDLEDSSGPGGQAVANDYDSFAEAYAAANESSLLNATTRGPRSWTWPGTWPGGGSSTSAAALARARDAAR